jgi:hypothetical protein
MGGTSRELYTPDYRWGWTAVVPATFYSRLMKLMQLNATSENQGSVIARFGNAALIKNPEGSHVLKGGSRNDRSEAREWISLFMHEVVVCDS